MNWEGEAEAEGGEAFFLFLSLPFFFLILFYYYFIIIVFFALA